MYKLTSRRFEKAKAILESYRDTLQRSKQFNVRIFERELRECWNVGYQELKSIIEDLSKWNRYVGIAAYYMEHSNATGVVSEFKPVLAKLYGIQSYDYAPDRDEAQDQFWVHYHDGEFDDE